MRRTIMLAFLLVILGVFNYQIYQKEQIKSNGKAVLLELAPVDPRSLMQGDYMHLNYAIDNKVRFNSDGKISGQIIVELDAKNVAQFVRLYQGETLADNEKLLRFARQNGNAVVMPNSFFFQEGHGEYYQAAKYGVFKFIEGEAGLLVGLADENGVMISPPTDNNKPNQH